MSQIVTGGDDDPAGELPPCTAGGLPVCGRGSPPPPSPHTPLIPVLARDPDPDPVPLQLLFAPAFVPVPVPDLPVDSRVPFLFSALFPAPILFPAAAPSK